MQEKALNISSTESTLVPSPCLGSQIPHYKLLPTIWEGEKVKTGKYGTDKPGAAGIHTAK